jgi:transposase
LPKIFGISDVLAAKILGHTGDITRFATAGHYASYTGTAPIEASSGDVRRHRLCRAGNRSALHLAARVQLMHPGLGQGHYRRKLAEHKTPREAFAEPEAAARKGRPPRAPGRSRSPAQGRGLT